MCQINNIDDVLRELQSPNFELYNDETIDGLFGLIVNLDNLLVSSYAQELIYKYTEWLKVRENYIVPKLKESFNFYFNYFTSTICNRLRVKRPEVFNTISRYFIDDKQITSMKIIDKLKESRNKIKLLDEEIQNLVNKDCKKNLNIYQDNNNDKNMINMKSLLDIDNESNESSERDDKRDNYDEELEGIELD